MSRPLGSKNKQGGAIATTMPPPGTHFTESSTAKIAPDVYYDLILGVRCLRNGQFKGLWELVKLDKDWKRQVLTDANARGMIINIANRQIMKIVVMQDAGR